MIVDAALGFFLELLLVPFLEQLEILMVQGGIARPGIARRVRIRMRASLALVSRSDLQELLFERIETHFLQARERIVADQQPITAILQLDGEEAVVDPHVTVLLVDLAFFLVVEECECPGHVHAAVKPCLFVESLAWSLPGGTVLGFVIAGVQPGLEVAVQFLERDGVAGADLTFELVLRGLNDAFDDATRRRVSRRPVQQLDVQLRRPT